MKIKETKLQNGLKVLIIDKAYLETVTILFASKVGSVDEPNGKNGVATLTRRMHLRGTKKYPNAQKLNIESERFGAQLFTSNSKETSSFGITFPRMHLHKAVALFSEVLTYPRDKKIDFKTEKKLLLTELHELTDDPLSHLGILINKQMFAGSKLAHLALGNEKDVPHIKIDDVKRFRKKYYSKNAHLVVCGDFRNRNIESLLDKYFPFPLYTEKKRGIHLSKPKKHFSFTKRSLNQPVFGLCHYTPKYTSKDYYPYKLVSIILGRGFGSKTMQIIREQHHLAYFARAYYNPLSTTGFGGIYAGVFSHKLEKAISLAREIVLDMKNEKITKNELDRAKGLFEGMLIGYNESSSDIASFYLEEKLYRNKIEDFHTVIKKMNSFSLGQIKRVSSKYFSEEFYLTLLASEKPKSISIT